MKNEDVNNKPELATNNGLNWKIHTPNLLKEVQNNHKMSIFSIPFRILAGILAELGERAIELNDDKLNAIMCRLTLFDQADPESKSYNPKEIGKLMKRVGTEW
jgi:hypothetical protein